MPVQTLISTNGHYNNCGMSFESVLGGGTIASCFKIEDFFPLQADLKAEKAWVANTLGNHGHLVAFMVWKGGGFLIKGRKPWNLSEDSLGCLLDFSTPLKISMET